MSAFRPVRIGVVGLGSFGRLHALTLGCLAEAAPAALVARRQASLDAAMPDIAGVRGWLDLTRALEESGAEAWVVATSTESHVEIAEQILRAGFPVLVEKPLSDSLSEAERLAPLVRGDSSNFMMGHIVLFNSEYRRLAREAAERPSITFISCVRHRPWKTRELFPGESPFHLTMVHDLYAVQALVGRREPASFSAQVRRLTNGAFDLAAAQLIWDDGLFASFTASFLTPDGMPADGYDRMEVYGEGWAARIDPNPRPLTVWDDRARAPLTLEIGADPAYASGMLAEELRCFCRVVRGVSPVPVGASFADALQVQRWLETLVRLADAER